MIKHHRQKFANALAVSAVLLSPAFAAELKGDRKAVDAIERMVERFGGKDVWKNARTLYVEYDGWRLEPNEPIIERAWRDLEQPNQRSEYEGRSINAVYARSRESAWVSRNGDLTMLDDEHLQNSIDRHPYGFYTSLHSFAKGDERLRFSWEEDRSRVVVTTDDGVERGWWVIDGKGALIKWGATISGDTVEYVYGPMRAFGNINYPAWGAATDGSWRWRYTDVDVSTEAFDQSVMPETN